MELGHLPLELACGQSGLARIARDVNGGGVVRVDGERRGVAELRPHHRAQVPVDLAHTVVGASDVDAVTTRRCRRVADEVVALVDGDDEERVALVDAVVRETGEELLERGVVGVQLVDVALLTRAVGEVRVPGGAVAVMCVGDVRIGDRDARLLHLRDPRQRVGRLHSVEAREADVAARVLDGVAVEIRHRAARLDHGVDVLRAEETVVAGVRRAGLVRKQIRAAVVRGRADRRVLCAMHADADEVGERLAWSGRDLGRLG